MENPNPNPKSNEGLSRRSIADIPDEQLSEILVRLPCYKTVIICKFVSKHWLSLLSNPKFVIDFVSHKRKKKQSPPPWTFNILRREKLIKDETDDDDESFIDTHNEVFYKSRKFSLNFLPVGSYKSIATFKDLILCVDVNYKYHYICNPVTKRWVALPPIPVSLTQNQFWTRLICEDPFNNYIDGCKLRVVVVPYLTGYKRRPHGEKSPSITLKVFVFCSENCEWIDVDVRFPLHTLGTPCVAHPPKAPDVRRGVVCKGMVCFCYDAYFGMFDPFKVTARARGSTIEARYLPIPFVFDRTKLVEWNGRLISFLPQVHRSPFIIKDGNILMGDGDHYISIEILYQELDLKQVLLNPNNNDYEVCWTRIGRRHSICIDKTKTGRSLPLSLLHGVRMMNIHPTKKHVFFILTSTEELILCDTKSSTLKTLGRSQNQNQSCRIASYETGMYYCSNNHTRLELQYWPTPLPTIPPSPSSS